MATRQRREYLQLLDKSVFASEAAIDNYNSVHNPYRTESTLILIANSWELLAKAVLRKRRISIQDKQPDRTITAEFAVHKLIALHLLDDNQNDCIQQIISLRNAATHYILPNVPEEITQHLLFFSCKFFRQIVAAEFPTYKKRLDRNYLALSFAELTTYAEKVQKIVARIKRNDNDKQLAWLLDRGIRFDGSSYITLDQFVRQYKGKKKVLPHIGISDFIKSSDMVRLVPVEAPKNYTADIALRKGKRNDPSLPVVVRRTDIDKDYPYFTKQLAEKLGKNPNFTSKLIQHLGIKGNDRFHQAVRASATGVIQKYSDAALTHLKCFLAENPEFNPYKK